MKLREWTILAVTGLCVGCGDKDKPGEPVTQPEPERKGAGTLALDGYESASLTAEGDAKAWASRVSAPVVFRNAYQMPLAVGDPDRDSSCPVQTWEGVGSKYTGGCTDKAGWKWFGTLTHGTLLENGTATTVAHYEGFGYEQPVTCGDTTTGVFKTLFNGEQTRSQSSFELMDFTLNLHVESSGLSESDCTTGSSWRGWPARPRVAPPCRSGACSARWAGCGAASAGPPEQGLEGGVSLRAGGSQEVRRRKPSAQGHCPGTAGRLAIQPLDSLPPPPPTRHHPILCMRPSAGEVREASNWPGCRATDTSPHPPGRVGLGSSR